MAKLDGEQFVALVQNRGDLSYGDANAAIRAVLETLSERISGGGFRDIASQLPKEVARAIMLDETRQAESFDSTEFLRRVARRLEVEPNTAEEVTYAVFSVLAETVAPEEVRDARSELPADLKRLFQPPSGRASGTRHG
jgi:uncharacterized protein (DUF2267 family)